MSDTSDRFTQLSAEAKRALLAELLKRPAAARLPIDALSYGQRALWYLYRRDPQSPSYNVPWAWKVHTRLDVPALVRAFQTLTDRHGSLRTTYAELDGRPARRVEARRDVDFAHVDVAGWSEEEVRRRVSSEAYTPFDLERGPVMRVRLFSVGDAEHVLLVTFHHIAYDLVSMMTLLNELGVLYSAYVAGTTPSLPAPADFDEFVRWQVDLLAGPDGDRLWNYWKTQLGGSLPVLELPTDRRRPAVQTFDGRTHTVRFDESLAARLRALAQSEATTLFTLLLAAFEVLLSRYTGETDVIVGSPMAGRTRPELQDVVGHCLNPVALRGDLSADPPFRLFLKQMRETTLGALEHQDYPLALLVERLRPSRDVSRSALFQVIFALNKARGRADHAVSMSALDDGARMVLGSLELEMYPVVQPAVVDDLVLVMLEADGLLVADWQYNTDLFDDATIRRMAGHFEELLRGIVADPDQRVSRLPLVPPDERSRLSKDWALTAAGYPDAPIPELFAAQVRRAPDATAVVCGEQHLTYAELDARAERLASLLRARGAGPDVRIGLFLERSIDLIVALVAIVKSGGAYVPLDPSYPAERLAFMMDDAKPAVLISRRDLDAELPRHDVGVIYIDGPETMAVDGPQRPAAALTLDHLAYVTYTSGSTGVPKGVEIPHRGVVRLLFGTDYAAFGPDERWLQLAPVSFDASTLEVWGALLHGATLVVYPERVPTADGLAEVIRLYGVTSLWLTASLFNAVIDEAPATLNGVRQLLIGGEALSVPHVRKAQRALPSTTIINGYGPTESTTFTCCYPIPPLADGEAASIPIGRPIANTSVYVVDANGAPVPTGVPGELWIGEAGLARGYQQRAALTAEKFVPDPFGDRPGARLYRTGDRVRWRPDGTLEFLGRFDHQVKIRGFRIEPGEIEAAVSRHNGVREAVVVVREDEPGDKRLVAYVVGDDLPPATELRAFLSATLPEYMLPSAIVRLDSLPLSPNGKVDRGALPAPTREDGGTPLAQPRSPIEQAVAAVWLDVLGLETVGIHDDFFELGGHSLLATQVVSRVRDTFGIDLSLRQLFEAPTIAGVAAIVESARRGDAIETLPPIVPIGDNEPRPLSFAQQRLWFLSQLEAGSAYNVSGALRLTGALDVAALEQSLATIVARHETLRTTFDAVGGRPVARVRAASVFRLDRLDCRGAADAEERFRRAACDEALRPFDLRAGPLLRATLVAISDHHHILLLTMHHIASDGWSLGVFTRELAVLYRAFAAGEACPLGDLPLQYADFAAWQQAWLKGEALQRQIAYWTTRLAHAPTLDLPSDRPRPAIQTYAARRQFLLLPASLAERAKALSRREGATLFMTLVAAFQALLQRYTGQDDVVIGTPIANRNRTEIEGLIGFFVNSLVLRTDLSGAPTFRELVARVREVTLGAYAHQDVPFEQLVEALQPERDLSRNPLFQVLFALQNAPFEAPALEGLAVEPLELDVTTTHVDVECHIWERSDGLATYLLYRSDLFDDATMERLLRHFGTLLEWAVSSPDRPIVSAPLLTDDERRLIVNAFNATAADYGAPACLHELVEAQVARTPEATALWCDGETLTYAQLDARANQLARYLRRHGVASETRVGVCLARSFDLVIALLGTLKAGGAYVPLDPGYPLDRLAFMVADSQPGVVLTTLPLADRVKTSAAVVACVDAEAAAIAGESAEPLACAAAPESLAYVIYTSGSTGRPKGAMNAHAGIVNRLRWMQQTYRLDASDVVLQKTPFSFDVSVWEFFWPLMTGARLAIARPGGHQDPTYLADLIAAERVTTVHFVPSMLQVFLQAPGSRRCDSLRRVICSGEALPFELQRTSFERVNAALHNLYGPTEAAVDVTFWECSRHDDSGVVPIGRPVGNTSMYVLDERGGIAPVGVPGELFIGGVQVGRGYLRRPELTAEKFIPDAFSGRPGARLYRTGDRARWRADGAIEYLGRLDDQVKLRGFRIELGEIEAVLVQHPSVKRAVVTVFDDRGDRRLAAYLVPATAGTELSWTDLRAYLRERLPEYMVPSAFAALDALPLSPNGKLDRRALPPPQVERRAADAFVAPRSEIEKTIAAVWRDVLGIAGEVGVTDNFFDLGGHSLLLVQAHARLVEALGDGLTLLELFQFPTVASLAAHIAQDAAGASSVPRTRERAVKRTSAGEREAVAVVGMAGRFPGAADLDAFWRNLRDGVESIRFFSDEELIAAGVDQPLLGNPRYVRARGVLDGVDLFDAGLFGYSPREAELIDPQHRLFLECAVEALERAGYDPTRCDGRIGVYAGASMNTYVFNLVSRPEVLEAAGGLQTLMGSATDFLPSRVSYKLDLRGPSVNVQTACSTSLVAVHEACRSLLDGECDLALAGGVSVSVPPVAGHVFDEGGITSIDGHCRAFDARARGVTPGNGVGIVVLKRLADAIADGDVIHGVVLGTAVNNDGSLKVGYTAPSVDGQAEVIAAAHAAAGVSPADVSYVEAHGTGTALGDPIEVAALTRAFASSSQATATCALGSLKTNVGHLDAAAGVAGLIKTVLSLEHREIPPSLHFETANPNIEFDRGPFFVNAALRPWASNGGRRRAGVSSFGIGGTNAHAVLEEAPAREASGPSRPWHVLMLSARTPTALETAARNLTRHLEEDLSANLADVAYTLQVGRREYSQRLAIVAGDRTAAIAALRDRDARRAISASAAPGDRPIVFMFPGQGAQYPGMARDVYVAEPVFRAAVDACADRLVDTVGFDVRDLLYATDSGDASAAEQLNDPLAAQAALFVVEYALATLWMSWGVCPSALIGHSVGEYVAACIAGVFSLDDALRLVATRGRLMRAAPAGLMLAVSLPEAEVQARLVDGLWLAAVNAPARCVVAGEASSVEKFEADLVRDGVLCQRLRTGGAFHSGLMTTVVEPLSAALRGVACGPPRIPIISTATGGWVDAEQFADPAYWGRQVVEPVRFATAVATARAWGARVYLEVGPGRTLSSLVGEQVDAAAASAIASLAGAREASDGDAVARAIAGLWVAGVTPEWRRYYADERRHRVVLPTYPFERQRYWIDRRPAGAGPSLAPVRSTVKTDVDRWFAVPSWTRSPLPVESANDRSRDRGLVFLDALGVGDRISAAWERRGRSVVRVRPGGSFSRDNEREFTVRGGHRADYDALFAALRADDLVPQRIAHLWGLTGTIDRDSDASAPTIRQHGFDSLIALAQAAGEAGITTPLDVVVVTDGVYEITGGEPLCPEKATVLGPCRVWPLENPSVRCRHVDLVVSSDGLNAREMERVLAELDSDAAGQTVAHRGIDRWMLTVEPAALASPAGAPRQLRTGGVYLITGGFGAIGSALGVELARTAAAKIALVGRRVSADAVATIEAAGAEVMPLIADVADPAQLRAAVAAIRGRWGRIDGVIHAAGVAGGGLIALKTDDAADAVLDAKVTGTRLLTRLLADDPPDFFVLCSSTTALTGGVGQVDYCAANAYLNAYARYATSRTNVFAVAIAWDTWRDGGMAVNARLSGELARARDAALARGISAAEGAEVFRRALSSGQPEIIVSTVGHERSTDAPVEAERARPDGADAIAPAADPTALRRSPRPSLATPYIAPADDLQRTICGIWEDLFGIEQIGIHDDFFELGGHSLLATRIVSRLHDALQIKLPLATLLQAVTVADLAAQVAAAGGSSGRRSATPALPASSSRGLHREAVELSLPQERLWLLHQLNPGSAAYHLANAARVEGPLDVVALRAAVNEIVRRHESLRTTFQVVDGCPRQIVSPELTIDVPVIDLTALPSADREAEAGRRARALSDEVFDLTNGPLLRVALFRLAETDHVVLVAVHHIVSDGWSLAVFARELSTLYQAFSAGRPSPLPELPIQYAQFGEWQRAWVRGEIRDRQMQYWRARLDRIEPLRLPTDRPRPAVQTDRGAAAIAQLAPSLTAGLHALSQSRGVTLFVTLMAAFQALLRRYTGQTDVAVGTPIANRNRTEDEDLIGFFVNTLVLRTDFSGSATFEQILVRARDTVVGALSNQDLPFEQLVQELRPERNLTQNPLFQVLFVFQNTPVEDFSAAGLRSREFDLHVSTTRFDLELYVAELPAGLRLTMCYNPDLFDAATIERMLGHLRNLLEAVVARPDRPVDSVPLLSPAERRQLLQVWNDTRADHPDACLHELFERQAARTPESIALVFEGTSLTYGELNRRANQLAHQLRTRGVGPEVLVGICMNRSLEMVVGLLGILKAGGAYVPLDPSLPDERIAFMLDDSQPSAVVTSEALLDRLARRRDLAVCLDRDAALLAAGDDTNPSSAATADSLAYAIYTSGSTGLPKGAMNAHRGVVNKLRWMQDAYGIGEHDRVMQKTPYTFDVSVWEFFWPLLNGARLVIARPGGHQDRTYIADLIASEQITIVHFVPSMLHAFLEEPRLERCASLTRVFCSGEALTIELQNRFFSRMKAQLHDLYGPTETAIEVTFWDCRRDTTLASVPIGRPVANTQAYILDETFEPVPIGVTGELFIGGIQVGRGYLRRPALTAEKFVPDPFSATPGARLYRTGDLTRFLPDGTIEYLGRADHQIKIRGFRIELGEIEAAIAQHPDVVEAAATVFETSPVDKRLVGYIVAKNGRAPSIADVRSFLKQKLPAYMVPSAIVVLDRLPQTSSGKVDRRALPAPDSRRRDAEANYVAPTGPIETALADIWKDLLRIERVGAHDNFFELGGHSLLATRVISAARDLFDVEIPLRSFFEGPTVADLGVSVTRRLAGAYDDEALAQMLADVKQLSDDDLRSVIDAPGPISR